MIAPSVRLPCADEGLPTLASDREIPVRYACGHATRSARAVTQPIRCDQPTSGPITTAMRRHLVDSGHRPGLAAATVRSDCRLRRAPAAYYLPIPVVTADTGCEWRQS